jgi:NTE family protein
MFVGTSAGAINAALFGSLAHLPARDAAQVAVDRWLDIRRSMVIRPALRSLPEVGVRYTAALLGLPVDVSALLDTSPLLASLNNPKLIDWTQLRSNLTDARVLDTVGVVATEYSGGSSGRSRVFYVSARNGGPPRTDATAALDYVPRDLTASHVLASSAIPAAFPPVRLGAGAQARWYMDGGVRLNTPLKPAVALGATGLVIIATDPAHHIADLPGPAPKEPPPLQDALDQVVHGVLSDRMIEDLQSLRRINRLLTDAGGASLKSASGRRAYRLIPSLLGCPPAVDDLGRVAASAMAEIMHGLNRFRNPDILFLNVLLGSSPASRSDLMSYLLFEPEFIRMAIQLGQEHGSNLLEGPQGGWQ